MTSLGINPNIWGPVVWDMVFYISNCTSVDLVPMIDLLGKLLPCPDCRASYSIYVKKLQPCLFIKEKNDGLKAWLFAIHDMVNKKLGKVCISFDVLEKRHFALSVITHDEACIDALMFMIRGCSHSKLPEMCEFTQYVLDCLVEIDKDHRFLLPHVLSVPSAPSELERAVLNARQQICARRSMRVPSMDEMQRQYDAALNTRSN